MILRCPSTYRIRMLFKALMTRRHKGRRNMGQLGGKSGIRPVKIFTAKGLAG